MTERNRPAAHEGQGDDSKSHNGPEQVPPGERTKAIEAQKHGVSEESGHRKDELPGPVESAQDLEGESKPFDYGGLPDRNLKKNLGCG